MKQIEFKLSEIDTKEKEDGEHLSYKYIPANSDISKEITLSVKKEMVAFNLDLPTDSIGDTILIEFGSTNTQSKLDHEEPVPDEIPKKRGRPKKDNND